MDGIFRNIPVECISPDEYQPRRFFDEKDMKKLEDSIMQVGVIQPLSVRYTVSFPNSTKEASCMIFSPITKERTIKTKDTKAKAIINP